MRGNPQVRASKCCATGWPHASHSKRRGLHAHVAFRLAALGPSRRCDTKETHAFVLQRLWDGHCTIHTIAYLASHPKSPFN